MLILVASAEEIFRSDIVQQIATAIDTVAINGGRSNEPTGTLQTSGIGSVAMGILWGQADNAKELGLLIKNFQVTLKENPEQLEEEGR